MKLQGGYSPKIAGRPSSTVVEIPLPSELSLSLYRHGEAYTPQVATGDTVRMGTPLAQCRMDSGILHIPSPAAGKVTAVLEGTDTQPASIQVKTTGREVEEVFHPFTPDRTSADTTREILAKAGIWPFFWSSATQGLAPLDGRERPRAIIVNCLSAEPFMARGNVILKRSWDQVVNGLSFLTRLLDDYGTIHLILTDRRSPLAQRLYRELAGQALLRFHPAPLRYPVEHPQVVRAALLRTDRSVSRDHLVWAIDVQAVAAVGACLAEGIPLNRRLVTVGGPGHPDPRHLDVPIGMPLSALPAGDADVSVLRGGLFTGKPVDVGAESLGPEDSSFFYLPDLSRREFLGFVNPGFDRVSILPCFATRLTGGADRHVSTYLRGELRPCIACGLCEKVCPVGILPQVLHRYLYGGQIDEAEAAGLERCVDCSLCTYVCPSKIELREQFAGARAQIRLEKKEVAEAAEEAEPAPEGSAWGGPL